MDEGISNLNKTKSGTAINTEKDRITYSSQTLQLLEQLRKSLKQWELNYLVISSTDGVYSFQQFFGENQFVKVGEPILSILPKIKEQLVGRMSVPTTNSGKITLVRKYLLNWTITDSENTVSSKERYRIYHLFLMTKEIIM